MSPSEALIAKTSMAEGHIRRFRRGFKPGTTRETIAMGQLECRGLLSARCFIWREDLLTAALAASKTLPSPVTLRPELIPVPSGLYFFGKPVEFDGCQRPLTGLLWAPLGNSDSEYLCLWPQRSTAGTAETDMGPHSSLTAFLVKLGVDVDFVGKTSDWRRLGSDEFDMEYGRISVLQFLISSWLWLKQVVVVSSPIKPSSHARKIAGRASVEPVVNVVTLRRSERPTTASVSDTDRQYSCQWLVSGHWRQQFYPSTREHRPIWIDPYVKGPEDKPFKTPTETVFSVAR